MIPIITSILDSDLYKFTMQQCVFHQYHDAVVKYEFKCRNKGVKLGFIKQELVKQIESFKDIRLTKEEKYYLGEKLPFLSKDYLDYLENYVFDPSEVIIKDENGDLKISIEGSWLSTILWEVPLLAVINELYFRHNTPENFKDEGYRRLQEKIKMAKQYPGFTFIEFGTRRRFSQVWQKYVLKTLVEECPNCIGTSNVKLAQELGIKAIGTFAHEVVSAHLSLANRIEDAQKMALYAWLREYDNNLGIALTDTFTTKAFFRDFGVVLSNAYQDLRHDSNDPIKFGYSAIEHYRSKGIDPKTKTIVFSDGLDIPEALRIYREFTGQIGLTFGIGTNISNDTGAEPLNIVIKLVNCNGSPVVKLSDNPGKAMGDPEMIEKVKKAYGVS